MRQKRWAAFDEFARVHGDSLVRLSFALCGDRGKAEDAAQEALTGVYLRWGRLDDPLPYARVREHYPRRRGPSRARPPRDPTWVQACRCPQVAGAEQARVARWGAGTTALATPG